MKSLLMTCIFLLALVFVVPSVFAQMGGGMTGGGQGQMMAPEKSQEAGSQSAGAKIFDDHCVSCHPGGGNIVIPALPLSDSRVLTNLKTFVAFLRNPRLPDGSPGSMPSFGRSKVSERQAKQLYQYLTTVEWRDQSGGYGMGPGMMGGHGMGRGSHIQSAECQKFYDDTTQLRKELHDKRFEYFETVRNPKSTMGTVAELQKEMRELQEKIYSKAPLGCPW
jgi:mono/diheme cytochrome c family protein